MYITLSDGTEVKLEFKYTPVQQWLVNSDKIAGQYWWCKMTVAILASKDHSILYSASTICSPKDQFRKSEGRRIAVQRLMAQLSKEDRAILGQAYFKRKERKK